MSDAATCTPAVSFPPKPNGLSRVRRNALFKIIGESTRAFSALLFILMARFLGGSEFGSFSVAMALAMFFAGAADGGLNQLMIRDIARGAERIKTKLNLDSVDAVRVPVFRQRFEQACASQG